MSECKYILHDFIQRSKAVVHAVRLPWGCIHSTGAAASRILHNGLELVLSLEKVLLPVMCPLIGCPGHTMPSSKVTFSLRHRKAGVHDPARKRERYWCL